MEKYLNWTSELTMTMLRSGIRIFIIVVLTILILRLIRTLSRKLTGLVENKELDIEASKRAETLGLVIRHTLNVLRWQWPRSRC